MYETDDRRLDAAVSLGIITTAQAEEIRALTPAHRIGASVDGDIRDAATGATLHLPRAIGAEAIGYVLGAMTVMIAMGWFLADRWEWLGAGGALAVSLLYGAVFLVVAWRLRVEDSRLASDFAVFLAVAMVPIAVITINELMGWFGDSVVLACGKAPFDFWRCRGEEIVVELSTIAAAVVAMRATRFTLFALPLSAFGLRFVFHFAELTTGINFGVTWSAWVLLIGTSLLTAVAYETSRRQQGDADFALWIHLSAAFSAGITSAMLLDQVEWYRHLLIPAALIAFAFSLRMRRFPWTLLGMSWFVGYIGWLAGEVFRHTPFFPIILAALGVSVIIATVWIQRNSAMLVARFGGLATGDRPSFPGGTALILVPVVAALVQMSSARALDEALRREREATSDQFRRQRTLSQDSLRRQAQQEIETKRP